MATRTSFQILGYINEDDRIFDVKEIIAKYMLAYESRPNKTTPSKFTCSSVGRNLKPEEGSKASRCGRPLPPNDHIQRVLNGESFNYHTKHKERALGCVDGNVHTLILEVSWPVSENQEGTDLQREGGERMKLRWRQRLSLMEQVKKHKFINEIILSIIPRLRLPH